MPTTKTGKCTCKKTDSEALRYPRFSAGGATSGINYLSDALTPRPGRLGRSSLSGLAGTMLMGAASAIGRDPRRGCETGVRDNDWMGSRTAYGYQYGGTQAGQEKSEYNGQRTSRYRQLTDDEISQLLDDIEALEADSSIFRFNEGSQTGFLDSEGIINVRGDVLPDLYSSHPRDLMSPRAVLAHEYYGHKHFDDVFGVRNPLPGSWNDEFRASYNAALNAPNLSDMDRMYLMLDALERAKGAGVNIKITDEIRRILYGY